MTDAGVVAIAATLVLGVRLLRDLRAKAVATGIERWSQRYGLSVTDDVRAWLVRRWRSSSLGFALGLWVGMVAGGLATARPDGPVWSLQGGLAVQAGWWVAGGAGAVLGGALGARLSPSSGPRVARSRAVTLADYAGTFERTVPLAVAVLALAVGLAPIVEGARGIPAASAVAAGVGSLVVVGIAELVARVAVIRPQPADGTHLLAWSDALRSETVRTALGAGALVAAGSLVVSVPLALRTADPAIDIGDATLWTGLLLVALVAASWIRSLRSEPARHYLRRLWPATAAELAENERPLDRAAR